MPEPYMASSLPAHQIAELHRLMTEEIKEVAVFFMDPHGYITVWNRAAEDMKGYTADDAIGSHLSLLYTDEERARGWADHNLGEARKHGFYREETWRRRKDGTLFWARIALTALRDSGGELVGFSKVTVDLTDHKLLESCVKEREETRRVLRAAHAGTWAWHPGEDRMEVCANFMSLLGFHRGDAALSLADWLELVAPEDRDEVRRRFAQARASVGSAPIVLEIRMCRQAGPCRWFRLHADWYREKDDDPPVLSGVNVDIHDLKVTGEELRAAVAKLEEADARKDEFLAMLAHELRNPLAPIRSAAELLKFLRLDDARVQKTSEIIARQVDHMTGLIDDLLDVSRVTRGLVELDRLPQDIGDVVTDALEQVAPLLRQRGHRLALRLTPAAVPVLGDRKRLVQVVANLLNNAAKYTPEGGSIVLRTELSGEQVTIDVSDDGIGMEPGLAAHAFELFAQAERTPDRSSGGLGIGLALVKSLVELHGGSVSCSSEGLGHGSSFRISLPLMRASTSPTTPGAAPRIAPSRRALKVLIVDDNKDAAEMLGMFLEASGHQVHVEHEPRGALEHARLQPPDVCLLDIGLPEMDGNELARRLHAQDETARAVLIAITGYSQQHDREQTAAAGFRWHLAKPVDPAHLVELLDQVALSQAG